MDCVAKETEACLKVGFAGIDDASAAGTVTLDIKRQAVCDAELDSAAKACDRVGMIAARARCLLAWGDKAKVGEDCSATAKIGCDGYQARCDPITTDLYKCQKAGGEGDGCKLGSPCNITLECLNTNLTRDMKCGKPGSTCHLSDSCPQGFQCKAEVCEAWTGGGQDSAVCKGDADCAVGWACVSGKCATAFCGL